MALMTRATEAGMHTEQLAGRDSSLHGETAYVEVDVAVIRPGQPL